MSGQATEKCYRRLIQEQKMIRQSPPEFIKASPDDTNILTWYYVIDGPKDTPYEGGKYIGKVKFPPDYPFAPPSILMTTPSGRFKPDTRLCLSISDFHPKEWNPVWNSATILTGLLSFMVSSDQTYGSIETSSACKRDFARRSHRFNIQQPIYEKLFPEDYAKSKQICDEEDAARGSALARKSDNEKSDANPAAAAGAGSPPHSKDTWADFASKAAQAVMLGCIGIVFLYAFSGSR